MRLVLLVVLAAATASAFNATDPASMQLLNYKWNTTGADHILSLSSGCPVQLRHASNSLNTDVLRNEYFLDSLSHHLSERTPERLVHAKGSGAFGYFEVINDATDVCKAKFLDTVGKKTRVSARFSSISLSRGGNDLAITIRGFSIKFYTEEGNYDIVGFNIPVFSFQDPVKFSSFTHAFKPNPVTNTVDRNMGWDFSCFNPDSSLSMLLSFTGGGLPKSYSRMPGYSIHTMQLANSKNETYFSRFYFFPDLGRSSFSSDEAVKIGAKDPDYLGRELYNAIALGNYPTWTLYMQPLTLEDVHNATKKGFDIFDVTKILSTEDYPLRKIGKLVLNENPKNYFADVEQLAFNPGNLVPGIMGSPDRMFQARSLAYKLAQVYRLGVNFNKLPVNLPLSKPLTYNRDGASTPDDNEGGAPNYYPNSFNGPEPVTDNEPGHFQPKRHETSNISQATEYYQQLAEDDIEIAVNNIVTALEGVVDDVQNRVIDFMRNIDEDLADRVLQSL